MQIRGYSFVGTDTNHMVIDETPQGDDGDGLSVIYPVIGILAAVFVEMLVMDIFRRRAK